MKILITGATGLVGKQLGLELYRQGHEIVVLSRKAKVARNQCPFPCEIIETDLTEKVIPKDQLKGIHAVFHLMGEPIASGRWTEAKKKSLMDSRIQSTQNLYKSFKDQPPKIFISASAIGFYGDRADEKLTENSTAGNGFMAELCKEWEAQSLKFKSENTRVAIARIGIVLAQAGGALVEMLPFFRAGIAGSLAGGQQWMSWIHINDLIQLFIWTLNNENVSGVFNAVAPHPVQNSEFTQTIGKIIRRPTLFPAPKTALSLVLGEKSAIITASQKVIPQKVLNLGFKFQYEFLEPAAEKELSSYKAGEDLFISQQYVSKPPEEIFPFFADAHNLEKLTPSFLNFQILNVSTTTMNSGTLIDYSLKVHGTRIKWRTEIEKWNPPFEFVDNQLKGPYALWHHTHTFEKLGPGTLMTDRVRFRLPLGFLGWLTAGWFVKKDILQIFNYRREKIADLF